MIQAGVRGRAITLKLKVRKPDANYPAKFMGHGACNTYNRSCTLDSFMADADLVG